MKVSRTAAKRILPDMSTGSRRFDFRRAFSRSVDGAVLLLLLAAGFLVLEFCVRPFYVPPPILRDPQVRFAFSGDLGWVMEPDPAAHTLDHAAPIGHDGFREMAIAEPTGSGDSGETWLLTGGGNAFGVGVESSETFLASAARDQNAPVALINAGCEGYDLYQSLRLLEKRAGRDHPDVLIVTFEPEDLPPGGTRDSLFTTERFALRSARLNRKPNPKSLRETLKQRSRLIHFLDVQARGFLRVGHAAPVPETPAIRPIDLLVGRDTAPITSAWNAVDAEFAALSRIAARWGSRVCVVVLPFPDQVRRPYPRARYQSRVREICARNGFLCVDPLEELARARNNRERIYLPRRPFLAPAGHRAVGRALEAALRTARAEAFR